jgi:uncharacterized protein
MQTNDVSRPGGGEPSLPWWRFGVVWFALGLPAVVVVASLVTGGIAWRYADRPIVEAQPGQAAQEPAVRARNHVTTPKR